MGLTRPVPAEDHEFLSHLWGDTGLTRFKENLPAPLQKKILSFNVLGKTEQIGKEEVGLEHSQVELWSKLLDPRLE